MYYILKALELGNWLQLVVKGYTSKEGHFDLKVFVPFWKVATVNRQNLLNSKCGSRGVLRGSVEVEPPSFWLNSSVLVLFTKKY